MPDGIKLLEDCAHNGLDHKIHKLTLSGMVIAASSPDFSVAIVWFLIAGVIGAVVAFLNFSGRNDADKTLENILSLQAAGKKLELREALVGAVAGAVATKDEYGKLDAYLNHFAEELEKDGKRASLGWIRAEISKIGTIESRCKLDKNLVYLEEMAGFLQSLTQRLRSEFASTSGTGS